MLLDMKNLQISIHNDLHDDLSDFAKSNKTNKADVIRLALQAYLKKAKQDKIKKRWNNTLKILARYSNDFTQEFDVNVSQKLLAETEW